MKFALIFRENEEPIEVSAEDVRDGLYSKDEEFVDPEYEFKVQFVKRAKNNGGPYFRLYYSYEEYKKLHPERASRYEIVANMRRYEESNWHKTWKMIMSDFCAIEKCVKNSNTNKRKFADAFYEKTQTCIEFQHSYIAFDFEERNKFYAELSIRTIWLYDLPRASVRPNNDGTIEILEDNARGFFRISENPDNLEKHNVYIQVKSGMIYRVKKLFRREISMNQKSTIRYFVPSEIYTDKEFVEAIKSNTLLSSPYNSKKNISSAKTLQELWQSNYMWMIVKNIENGDLICINRNHENEMFRDYSSKCIKYVYVDNKYGYQSTLKKEYLLSHQNEHKPIWIFEYASLKPRT